MPSKTSLSGFFIQTKTYVKIKIGSVQKYFVGLGWAIENFRRQIFWPLFASRKTFLNPLNMSKLFCTPMHCYVYNISFFPGQWFIGYDVLYSSVASPIRQEGKSERTFPIFPLFSSFPSFFRFLATFLLSRGHSPPSPTPPPRGYATGTIGVIRTTLKNWFYIHCFPSRTQTCIQVVHFRRSTLNGMSLCAHGVSKGFCPLRSWKILYSWNWIIQFGK